MVLIMIEGSSISYMYLDKKTNGEGNSGKYLENEKEENIWRRVTRKIIEEGKRGKYLEKEK